MLQPGNQGCYDLVVEGSAEFRERWETMPMLRHCVQVNLSGVVDTCCAAGLCGSPPRRRVMRRRDTLDLLR